MANVSATYFDRNPSIFPSLVLTVTARADEAVNKTTAKKQNFILSSIRAPFNSNDLVIQVVSKLELTVQSDIFDNFFLIAI